MIVKPKCGDRASPPYTKQKSSKYTKANQYPWLSTAHHVPRTACQVVGIIRLIVLWFRGVLVPPTFGDVGINFFKFFTAISSQTFFYIVPLDIVQRFPYVALGLART
jgi:hypothetical protein